MEYSDLVPNQQEELAIGKQELNWASDKGMSNDRPNVNIAKTFSVYNKLEWLYVTSISAQTMANKLDRKWFFFIVNLQTG